MKLTLTEEQQLIQETARRFAASEATGGRIGIGSLALGIASAAMDFAREYSTQREQFGTTIASMRGPQWIRVGSCQNGTGICIR